MLIPCLFMALLLSTALLAGSEFCIAALVHPALASIPRRESLLAIQQLGKRFGQVMPFWMGGTLLAHAALAWSIWREGHMPPRSLSLATGLWILIIVYSLLGPVPINNRVIAWNLDDLPENWKKERQAWERLNWIRVVLIGIALFLLLHAFFEILA